MINIRQILLILLLLMAINGYTQNENDSFWSRYQYYQKHLYENISDTKIGIENKLKGVSKDDDTTKLLYELILFDLNEIYGNKMQMKFIGQKLKSQEIIFDDPSIKMLISLRYQKVLVNINDEYGFDKSFYPLMKSARDKRDYKSMSLLYVLNARLKAKNNQRDSALYYMNMAVINIKKQKNQQTLIDVLLDQATLLSIFKNEETSVSKAYVALQNASEIDYLYGIYRANILIATINSRHQNYAEVLHYLNRARKPAVKMNFQFGIDFITLFELQSKNEFAQEDFQKIQLIKDHNSNQPKIMALLFTVESKIQASKGQLNESLSLLNKAIVAYEGIEDLNGAQAVYQQISDILIRQRKYEKAIYYLNKSMSLLNRLNYNSESTELYKKISEVYEKEGDKAKALVSLKKYVRLKDSLQLVDIQTNLLMLQQQNLVDKRERLITLQADSIKQQKQERDFTMTVLENVRLKNNLKTYIIIGFSGLILLGGIILFFKWNQNLIQQHQREAEMNQTLLRTQMNPHFVFNAMSVIQSYLYENDTENSTKFLVNFSRLMRLILENSSKEFISIQIERDILDKYLSIQKIRFENRFNFSIFTEDDLLNQEVQLPPMITQPFIENAIEHGQLHLKENGFIHVYFRKLSEKLLEIKVIDNGVGRKYAVKKSYGSEMHKSMAIGITKDRIVTLNRKYGTNGAMTIEDLDKVNETGTVVTITIPYIYT